MTERLKPYLSIAAFIAAVVIGFIALFIPPAGIIDPSVLWFTALLLVFVSGLLGINLTLDGTRKIASTKKDNKEHNL